MSRRGYEKVPDEDRYPIDPEHRVAARRAHKEIAIGVLLLVLGAVFIACGILIHLEHWENKVPGTA